MSVAAEVVALSMTRDEARRVVEQIRGHMENARRLIYDLHKREGWRALGYKSWRECVVAEFNQSEDYLYKQLRAAEIESEILDNCLVGQIPEGQLRPLAVIKDEPELVREAWHEANASTDGNPTGRDVKRAVDAVIERHTPKQRQAERPVVAQENVRRGQNGDGQGEGGRSEASPNSGG